MYSDEQISAYEEQIKTEYYENRPLVSEMLPIELLTDEFTDSEFQCVEELKKFSQYRTVRRDGNCFFRAYLTGFLEETRRLNEYEFNLIIEKIKNTKNLFDSVGFDQIVYEDFLEYFIEHLQRKDSIEDILQEDQVSNSLVVFLRLWTSAFLRLNAEKFEPFIQMNMKEYCERWVECFGKESEHVQLHALCEATGIGINVWCFEISHLSLVVMQEPKMNLLYRPGHYDILYY